uniref:Uncharacterized protein n=1 Tax=Anguilla anguilla TaxID=7936 RepID=A0A0E9RUX2_ANGAN
MRWTTPVFAAATIPLTKVLSFTSCLG